MKTFTLCKRFLPFFGKLGYDNLSSKSAPSLTKGMALIELMAGMVVAGVIFQLAYFGFAANRNIYLSNLAKNDADQNMKTLFDLVGPSIQQAGQGFGDDPNFPVILINEDSLSPVNSDGSKNSEVTIRQVVADISLPVCATVNTGVQTQIVIFDNSQVGIAGCTDTDSDNNGLPDQIEKDLAQWKNYRANNGGTIQAYIYNGNGQGQFFNYTGELFYNSSGAAVTSPAASPTSSQVAKVALKINSTFTSSYTAGSPRRILLIKEQKYRLGYSTVAADNKPNTLQVSTNNETPTDLVNKIGQFTVKTTLQQDVTPTSTQQFECQKISPSVASDCSPVAPNTTSFVPSSYAWSQIYAISVKVKPQAMSTDTPGYSSNLANTLNNMTQTQKFLPRNVLNF